MGDEPFNRPGNAGARGGHQHRFATVELGVRIGPGGKKQIDDRHVSVRASQRQRLYAVAIGGFNIRAGGDQFFCQFGIVVKRGPMQCGHAIDLHTVDIGPVLEQIFDQLAVGFLDRVDKPRIGIGRQRQPTDEYNHKREQLEFHSGKNNEEDFNR